MMRAVAPKVILCVLFALGLNAQTLDETVRTLARRVMTRLGPADVPRVTARSLSNLGNAEVNAARTIFERAIRRPMPRQPQTVDVTLTLSQSVRGYLIVADFDRNGQRAVEMVEYRPSAAAESGRALLDRQLLIEQDAPILDVAVDGDRMFVLEPSSVVIYKGGQRVDKRAYASKQGRDPRGRLELDGGEPRVSAPGVDQPFALAGETVKFVEKSNVLQAGGRPPLFALARARDLVWIAETDGRIHLYELDKRPAGLIEGWGSDVAESPVECGAVLASAGGDRDANDTLTMLDIVDRRPAPVSDPLQFSGAITALWPVPNGATAITRNSATGKYAAYKITIRCSQ